MFVRAVRLSLVALLTAAAARAQAPRIDALDPAQGPIAGGTVVTIRGANLAGASVTIDSQSVAVTEVSPSELRVTTPEHANGYALLKASTPEGTAYSELLYVPPKLEELPPGYITTVAGTGVYYRFHFPATTSNIVPFSISTDSIGSIYMGSPGTHRVLRIRPDGILEPFAGNGTFDVGPNGDGGPATEAWMIFPRTCVLDAAGNAYIPDARNRIRRVDGATGIISTIAGTGVAGFSGDGGPATAAQIHTPTFLAVAPDGTIYFIDFGNARIRRIATDGTISTVAGNGVPGYSGDGGSATQAQIEKEHDDAAALALDPRGFLYLVETLAGRVRRIDLGNGIISTFLPRPDEAPPVFPWGLAVDGSGNVFIGMTGTIVKYSAAGEILASWGDGSNPGFSEDGTPVSEMRLANVTGVAIDPAGNPLFVDESIHRIRRINLQTGLLETIAGIGPRILGIPGPATGAVLTREDGDVMFLPNGDLLLSDEAIFKIDREARIAPLTVLGPWGSVSPPGGGRHISTVSAAPGAMASDGQGGFYTCDGWSPAYYVDSGGYTHHLAGTGENGYAGDGGAASAALLTQPGDIAVDGEGNVLIADTNNNRIRRVDQAGIITTVAGGGPLNGFEGYCRLVSFCGDGGPALEACLNTPFGIAVDPDGNLFIGDTCNGRIRKVDRSGTISTFSDMTGSGSFNKLFADPYGGLFAQAGSRVWRFLPDGTSWPIAGTGEPGFSGDGGLAVAAEMWGPGSNAGAIDVDGEGNLVFHDNFNHRVRAVRFGAVLAPPDSMITLSAGSGQSAPLGTAFPVPLEISVKTSWGSPAPGVRVDFQTPPSGPSCVFANGTTSASALTDRSGRASAICRAAGTVGSFEVAATPLGSGASVTFDLINTARPPRRRAVRK